MAWPSRPSPVPLINHTRMLRNLQDEGFDVPGELFHWTMKLDRNYIAPRYSEAYLEGSPFEYCSGKRGS
ncbi:hypothetical protein PFDSM3638_01160 [Pyrococcus furiosus DSM 3638]|uniref:Uncharacterized protein n=2 Tax=Pyrococcus furiosus TaxID=2261 RepID=A0A5C0XNF9_PYRFU|nr:MULTISPECIES: hypothetical protein [Pyrococcus]AFN03030.1 HEPN domain-containing protein [Pyrococcus furiosus COM1]QEK77965.1 hypothetical protein PFDSM3638_01160 [Pyrococcus furiosus DSM 3638]